MAVKAAVSFILFLKKEQRSRFTDIIPRVITVVANAINGGDERSAVDVIGDCIEMAEHIPVMFRDCFAEVVQAMAVTASTTSYDVDTRGMAIEFLTTIAESHPGMCRRYEDFAKIVVPMCLSAMTEIEDDPVEWCQQNTESMSEDDDEIYLVGEQALDRIAVGLGDSVFGLVASNAVPMLQSGDWRHRHAALMALSSIGEGCHSAMKLVLNDIIQTVAPMLGDENPRVKFAACNAMGQMATDFAPIIQEHYHAVFMNGVLPLLDMAQFPRLQAHGAAALVNFADISHEATLEISKEMDTILEPYLDLLLTKLLTLLQSNHRFIQEQVITTIGILADAANTKFTPYYDSFMPLLRGVLSTVNDADNAVLRGRIMECITLIGMAVGKARFFNDASEIMHEFIRTGETISEQDPQLPYLLSACTRICKVLGKEFIIFFPYIYTPLKQTASIQPNVQILEGKTGLYIYIYKCLNVFLFFLLFI